MEKMDGKSSNILENNIKKMKELFPEVFTEDKVDFEKLSEVLGEYKENEEERYNFTWNGKKNAIKISQTPTTGTLRPDKKSSKNWDETENVYIEGDNLEVLKLLQKSYHSKIKMIYIDPPYNTGNDFVYKDNYRDNMKNYLKYTGQVDSDGKKISANPESSGRYHTDWLNMMYPRLRLARNLLTEDGIIFISIDDNEVHNLRKICDEIFGETNFVSNIIWEKKSSPQNDAKWLSDNHDHILLYSKNKEKWNIKDLPRTEEQNKRYTNPDNDSRGPWTSGDLSVKTYSEDYDYPITTPGGKTHTLPPGRCWMTSQTKMKELISDNRIWFGKDGNNLPRLKRFLSDVKDGITPTTIWKRNDVGDNQKGKRELLKVMPENVFQTPKTIDLIKRMTYISNIKDEIVLDFFSGSGTTAHAVMDSNIENNEKISFIMVQLPEETSEDSEAFKSGYKTISDIGRERIRRAGEQIRKENKDKEGIEDLDVGFKAFKLDNSNIKEWNPEYEDKDIDFETLINNFVEDRSQEDILYEIILKYGIDLTVPIEEHHVDGKIIYDIGFGTLYICLDNNIDENIIQKIVESNKKSKIEKTRVVFKDTGFKDDQTKLNAKLTLENNGIEEVLSI